MKKVKHVISWDSDSSPHEEYVNIALQVLHNDAVDRGRHEADVLSIQHTTSSTGDEGAYDIIFSTLITYIG